MKFRQLLCGTTVCYPLSVAPSFTLERALEGIAGVGLRAVELVAIPGYCEHLWTAWGQAKLRRWTPCCAAASWRLSPSTWRQT